MAKYRVYMQNLVSHYLDVEAESPEQAMDEADERGLHGVMLLDHTYPDEGGWEAFDVMKLED